MSASRGKLCLVLHAHMPYVEGFGTWPFGEEWLWEALCAVYLPLFDLLKGADVTLELSPVLCDQLELLTSAAGRRFVTFADQVKLALCESEAQALEASGQPALAANARAAADGWSQAARRLEDLGGEVVRHIGELSDSGTVELWTGSATHAVLPLVATDAVRSVQIRSGIASHRKRFGRWTGGFWLAECGYEPGIEHLLARMGVSAFCVDQTEGLGEGALEQLEPVATEAGCVALPLDWQTMALVWDERGYPSHPAYRDFHAKTHRDLRVFNNAGQPYDRSWALRTAREHARDFVGRAIGRLDGYHDATGREGLLCCAFDAELFGHFWHEGLSWLEAVFDEARVQGLELCCVSEALEGIEPVTRQLAASTWGERHDFRTWDAPAVCDPVFDCRRAELELVRACSHPVASDQALHRAVRELLALQASDWPFQITRGAAADYPFERLAGHREGLDAAFGALGNSSTECEPGVRNLTPALDIAPLVQS